MVKPVSIRTRKRDQDYEARPPRCCNCQSFKPIQPAIPALKVNFNAPKCLIGGFIVEVHGICNRWTGKDGDVLE